MLLYLVVISFITLFLQRALVNTLASKQFAYNESLTSILKVLNETLVNKSYIRIYRLNNYFLNKFNKVSEESTDKLFDITFKEDMIEVINQTSAIIIEIGMYLLGIVLIFNNNLSTESLLAIVTSASSITLPVYSFSRVLSKFKKTKDVRDKITNLLEEDKIESKNHNIHRIKSLHLIDYMGKYKNKNVNKPINENLENDKKYLIIGSNGSGKSTLLKNLLLEHNNYQGDININQNIELKAINGVDYLKNISYVSQDQVLINGSIKENIILGYEYDEIKYESIKKLMGLDKFDDSVPLDSERVKLSGGEKQKIVIGRAIYKSSDFIILDEPFSNLDYNTSTRLLDYLINEDKRGLIVVEHKINKEEYVKFDKVIELNRIENIM